MKKAHTLTAMTVLALALTGCGNTETKTDTATEQTSSATTSATPSAAPAPEGVQLIATDRFNGEKIATYTFYGKDMVECAGKTMLQLEFRVDAEPNLTIEPNYNIAEWEGYINGIDTGENPVTLDAAKCLPTEYHDVSIKPGDSVDIVVLLDTDGLDAVGYKDGYFDKPLTLTL